MVSDALGVGDGWTAGAPPRVRINPACDAPTADGSPEGLLAVEALDRLESECVVRDLLLSDELID